MLNSIQMEQSRIKQRIFLLGCPRSGTTLLQSFIAGHSQVTSFPESKFFQRLVYPGTWRSRLGIASGRARLNYNQFFQDIGRTDVKRHLPSNAIFIRQYAYAFVASLDALAEEENRSCWLEKTPAHIQRISYIERLVPQSKFIHIIRDGRDVVASLYSVSREYPETWNGSWDIDKCIQRWLSDTHISYLHSNKANHLLVRYESLVDNPNSVLKAICEFLNLSFEDKMIENRSRSAKNIVRDREKWKESVSHSIEKSRNTKFKELFDNQQIEYITNRLSN